jgi:hypothetical protein
MHAWSFIAVTTQRVAYFTTLALLHAWSLVAVFAHLQMGKLAICLLLRSTLTTDRALFHAWIDAALAA